MSKKVKTLLPIVLLGVLGLIGAFNGGAKAANTSGLNTGDIAWMLTASALVLLMTPGLSFFYGGMVGKRNVISTMLQSFISLGVVSLLWIVVGFSLAFGKSVGGFIGDPRTFFFFTDVGSSPDPSFAATIPLVLFALFQLKFAIITPALVTGAFAERIRFNAYLLFITLFSIFIYAPLAHWTWHPEGILRVNGVLDFAGGTVVHLSAGLAALAGAMVLGPRRSKAMSAPANIPFVILGTGMLWFGWFGFNAGSALGANELAATAFLTTNSASAAAMLTWIFLDMARGEKPTALGACIGAVVGLVAITPAAGFVSVGPSITIGVIASAISHYAVRLRTKSEIDDTLDVFPCHGVGGIVGMILTAVFANDKGLVFGETETFIAHTLSLLAVSIYVFGGSWILYKVTDLITPLRVLPDEEFSGLDISQHGETIFDDAAWERAALPIIETEVGEAQAA